MDWSLLAAGLVALPVGLVYAWIGLRFNGREVSHDAETALVGFTTWWFGLAAYTLVQSAQLLLVSGGVTDLNLFVGLQLLETFLLAGALWGLLVYLGYLWLGTTDGVLPGVAGGYLGVFLVVVYLVTAAHPIGLQVGAWQVDLAFATPPTPTVELGLLALLTVPPLASALAYLSLYPQIDDRTRSYRVLLVSLGVVTWFGAPLAAALTGLSEAPAWPLVERLVGLAAALAILAAYAPPEPVRQRWGVEPLAVAEGAPG